MKYGLVLAGGGVRGAFHIGVWKGLREMGMELCAVAGTSIGAINGALIAQDEYEKAFGLWRSISIDDIIALPDCMEGERNIFKLKNAAGIAKDIYKNAGLNMAPLEEMLRGIIDEKKLRASAIDFGMAAFSLTDKKGIYKFIREIPDGQLIDYILASASILSAKTIGFEKLSDGGMYDNMPVSMLAEKDISDIITVDVQGIGINRGFFGAGKNIIQIRSREPQTGIMEFDTGGISRSIDEGYLAAMKAFGRVMGDMYCFNSADYLLSIGRYGSELISGLEKAAKILDINSLEVYNPDGLTQMVMDAYEKQAIKSGADFSDSSIEKIRREGDNVLLVWLVKTLEGKKTFVTDKLSVLGSIYDAASAILYFKK